MIIRKMNSDDLEIIIELEKRARQEEPNVFPKFKEDAFRVGFKKESIEDVENNEVILCIDNEKVIGRIDVIIERSFFDFERVGYIDWVYVLKSYRKQGIAKRLFSEAEKLFLEKEVSQFYLFVAKNEEAQAFYKRTDIEVMTIERGMKRLK